MNVNNCVLVTLNISVWEANRQDRRVSAEVAEANRVTDQRLCRLRKSLLPKNTVQDKLQSVARAARNFHYANTHTWMHSGPRMLPTKNFDAYMTKMRAYKAEYEQCVLDFISEYDSLKVHAQYVLGSLYNALDYPDVTSLGRKFSFDTIIQPMPASDVLLELGLDTAEADEFRKKLEADMAKTFERANRSMWEELYSRLEKLYSRLNDESANVRAGSIEAVRSLAEMLPRMNVTNDETLEALSNRLQESLKGMSEAAVNNNPSTREKVKTDTQAVFNVMSAYMAPRRMVEDYEEEEEYKYAA